MPFSSAFAQGLEIGRSSRKQKAVTNYFEKLKALEQQPETATPTADVAAIPTEQAGEGMAAALNPQTALPTDTPQAPRVSLGRADLESLDAAAMEAARASGDISVFTALKSNTDVFIQGKLLNNLRSAQVALLNGDTATAEKALRKANYYVPNGQDIQTFKGPGGELMWTSPISGQKEPITADTIGYIQAAASNPMQFTQLMAGLRSQAKEDEYKAKNLEIQGQNAAAATKNAETNARQATDTAAYQRGRLIIDRIEADAKVLAAKTAAQVGSGGSGKDGAITPADRKTISDAVQKLTRESIQPEKTELVTDQLGSQKAIKTPQPPPPGFENVTEVQLKQIASYAEDIALARPTLTYGRAVEMAKERYLKDQAAAKK